MCGWGYSFSMLQVLLVTKVHFAAFCGRLSRAKAVPLHRISKRAEIAINANYSNNENYEKLRKQRKRIQTTMSLPIFRQRNQSIKAEFNLLLRSQMPTMLIYAKIAAEYGISEDRVRQIIRSP